MEDAKMKSMKRKWFPVTVAVPILLLANAAQADAKWTWEAGKQNNNGAITIKSVNGSTTYTGKQNPTGAAVKVNQNAATQPPTLIMSGSFNRWSLYYVDRAAGLP